MIVEARRMTPAIARKVATVGERVAAATTTASRGVAARKNRGLHWDPQAVGPG